jgi:hypothetical protein
LAVILERRKVAIKLIFVRANAPKGLADLLALPSPPFHFMWLFASLPSFLSQFWRLVQIIGSLMSGMEREWGLGGELAHKSVEVRRRHPNEENKQKRKGRTLTLKKWMGQ